MRAPVLQCDFFSFHFHAPYNVFIRAASVTAQKMASPDLSNLKEGLRKNPFRGVLIFRKAKNTQARILFDFV